MKKFILPILALFIASFSINFASSASFFTSNPYIDQNDAGSSEDITLPGAGLNTQDSFISVVRGFINRVLGILALIALIVLLRGGFQMVTAAGNEERYNNGFKILKQAAVGLALIGVAWFIITLIFFVIGLVTTEAAAGGAGTS